MLLTHATRLLIALSVMACIALTACDAAAEHRVPEAAPRMPLAAPAPEVPAVSATGSSRGAAALREYREDADPSHAAIASYRD